jgi:hypothetical protein
VARIVAPAGVLALLARSSILKVRSNLISLDGVERNCRREAAKGDPFSVAAGTAAELLAESPRNEMI